MRVLLCSFLLCIASGSLFGQYQFPMPTGHVTGLSRPAFTIEPKFSFQTIGSEKHLILKMDVQMGTAISPGSGFSYRYKLQDNEYTDQDLGKEPFNTIRLYNAAFSVLVQGPSLQKTILYEYVIGHEDLGIVSNNAVLSTYGAHIKSLDNITYHGTEAVEAAIRNYETGRKKTALQNAGQHVSLGNNLNAGHTVSTSDKNNAATQEGKKGTVINSNSNQPTTARPKEDFWSEKKATETQGSNDAILAGGRLIPEQPNHKNLPEFVRTTNGGYYHKGADGRFRQVSEEEYQKAKSDLAAKNAAVVPEEKQMTAAEINAKVDKLFSDARERDAAIDAKISRFGDMMRQNFYYAEAIRNGKQNLAELSTLSGNYNSIEQLQVEFNQKYYAINEQVRQLEEARNAKLNNAVSNSFNGSSTEQAIGQGVALVGGIFNSAKASKEAKEAREALRIAKEKQEKEIIAAKQKARVEMRKQLMKYFPNGGTPLTAHKITTPEVYMFGYVVDPAVINNETANVTVSNVFPVAQYSDGSYPLKTSVSNKLKGIAKGNVVLVGFYSDKNAADQMRNSFIALAQKSELTVNPFTFKTLGGNSAGSVRATGDFWETDAKIKAVADTTKKKNDFWNN